MKITGLFIAISLWYSIPLTAQDQHTIVFGSEKATINCISRAAEGYCKNIAINSTVPMLVFFMKNDKSETNIMGKTINVFYKNNDAGEEVADITIDGTNWWSTRCLYYVTVWTNAGSVNFDGTRFDLTETLQFDQVGFPFSVSKLTSAESK